ncbi:H-NS family nucleoid-associated regulatory protein [Paraburkholderia sp. BCC1884]|uniref:H-NS family nucleoid-associated regulatory protein n=1 Tax=Paraburkholderia sp. BCC1884 TaxID=2562668 RepID=UPI001183C561|nr:H-NS family nucleoid-associated regulatory protein [Paraburkholderia sp. BCC1884]
MGKIVDGEASERLIIWIRRRMKDLGITIDDLAASIEHDLAHLPIFRDAWGNEWDGRGDMPDWLKTAKNAGVSPDFFRVTASESRSHPPRETARSVTLRLDFSADGIKTD